MIEETVETYKSLLCSKAEYIWGEIKAFLTARLTICISVGIGMVLICGLIIFLMFKVTSVCIHRYNRNRRGCICFKRNAPRRKNATNQPVDISLLDMKLINERHALLQNRDCYQYETASIIEGRCLNIVDY
ncbi:hypothetical protein NERG_00311 [Nematocida ausubeli]|uniref:Uncharacterized protein n=1 Tax=Nematocida ausubeli (strain ATCC PRA-371 / ERTm2) TaxID=1913371 RepID=H8Z9P0_NEMA1|nr:hypothetical protein NERG_00311 [Nematocida ausubeli]